MKTTPLYLTHIGSRAHMGEFAGYGMPLYYAEGVIREHEWVRSHAGIFDVSHMGQIILSGPAGSNAVANFLERLTPSGFQHAEKFSAKYTVFTNEIGGIVDDLIVTRLDDDRFFLVVNAGTREKDIAWMLRHLPQDVDIEILDRALVALQGPDAERVMREALAIDTSALPYMHMMEDGRCKISRLGYTGEDGFEISLPKEDVDILWQKLSAHPSVKPIGLAARDSLRLEMGYSLYGHDITDETAIWETGLTWVIGKENAGFIGADRKREAKRKRIGFRLLDKGIAREGAEIRSLQNEKIGIVTSGGFSPTLKQSIGQGYVPIEQSGLGNEVYINIRGANVKAVIEKMPFVEPKVKK